MSDEIVGYRSYHTGRQIDEAVDMVLGSEGGIVFVDSEQTITNKTINAPDNNITNLTLDNFDPNVISYYAIDVPQWQDNMEYEYEPKVATDVSIASYSPFVNGAGNNEKIADNEVMKSVFRNMGYALRDDASMYFCTDNTYVFSTVKPHTYGTYNYHINYHMFSPGYTYTDLIEQAFYEHHVSREEPYLKYQENTVQNSYIMRAGNAFWISYTFFEGLNLSEYHNPNSETQRNYMFIEMKGPFWLIPLTVYEVELKAIKDEEVVFVRNVCTDVAGNSGATCNEDLFWDNWNNCNFKNTLNDLIWSDYDTVEAKYTGEIFSGYRVLGDANHTDDYYKFGLDSVEERDSDKPYREVRLPYNRYDTFQEVEDSQGHIGYVWSDWNNTWNTENLYVHSPGTEVEDWQEIFKSLIPSNEPETWENTGDFKYTFRMFQGCDHHNTDKIAYKSYQLVSSDGSEDLIRWTTVAGEEDESFAGYCSDQPNEAQYPYDEEPLLYTVNNGGQTYCVKASDLEDAGVSLPPTVGEYLPEGIGLFDGWDMGQYVQDTGFEDTTFESADPITRFKYSGETIFIYNNQEDLDAEQYFSEDNWGIFKNNYDSTYTKIPEAYQWDMSCGYYYPDLTVREFTAAMHGLAPDGVPVMRNDWRLDGIENWWITQAWEVQTEWEGKTVKGWTGIPPEGATEDMVDFSQFAGDPITHFWYRPIDELSDNPPLETSITWDNAFYTGNYEPDFVGRWTKIQNGEL